MIGRPRLVSFHDRRTTGSNPTGGEEGCWGLTGPPARFDEAGK
jgi:hypothetical protein